MSMKSNNTNILKKLLRTHYFGWYIINVKSNIIYIKVNENGNEHFERKKKEKKKRQNKKGE